MASQVTSAQLVGSGGPWLKPWGDGWSHGGMVEAMGGWLKPWRDGWSHGGMVKAMEGSLENDDVSFQNSQVSE